MPRKKPFQILGIYCQPNFHIPNVLNLSHNSDSDIVQNFLASAFVVSQKTLGRLVLCQKFQLLCAGAMVGWRQKKQPPKMGCVKPTFVDDMEIFFVLITANITNSSNMIFWLVVSTPLKNISQLGLLFPIYGKIKNVPNHQPVFDIFGCMNGCLRMGDPSPRRRGQK